MDIKPHPDIFWIVADEYRADGIGAYGNPWIKTPNLDRLVEGGVIFTNAFCQAPACVASRASFLSGRYPHRVGNMWFRTTADSVPFIPEYFEAAGYRTVNIGKEDHHRRRSPFQERYLESAAGGREGDPVRLADEFQHREKELGLLRRYTTPGKPLIVAGTNPLPPEEAETGRLVARTLDYLQSYDRQQPLFLHLSGIYPHTPVLPPEPYDIMYDPAQMVFSTDGLESIGRTDFELLALRAFGTVEGMRDEEIRKMRAHYYGLCTYVDSQVGRLLEYLEAYWDRPYLVVFHTDHGNLLGEHGLHEKFSMYENARRVPLIVTGTGIPRGKRIENLVELVDLAPTLMHYAGLPISAAMGFQGRDLLPLLLDENTPWREAAFCEFQPMHIRDLEKLPPLARFVRTEIHGVGGYDYPALRNAARSEGLDLEALEEAPAGSPYRYWLPIFKNIRTAEYTCTVRAAWLPGQGGDYMGSLYDLEKDPYEMRNVYREEKYGQVVTNLIERLKSWDRETR